MRMVFRVDSSLEIGSGHIMRCLTLAKALRERGVECLFLSRNHQGNLNELLRSQGFAVSILPFPEDSSQASDQDITIRAPSESEPSWRIDAELTIKTLGERVVNWLIVDHYALDKHWESELRTHAKNIMVIDDLADREHYCDLLLDQNIVADFETRYDNLVGTACARLLGPKYALLQPEYAEIRSRIPPRNGHVGRILVYFGGSDLYNLTGLTISAFLKLRRKDLQLDVVINPNSPNAASIESQVEAHANITVHGSVPSLAPLMARADLAIGACGATTWERCCVGLPSIVITLAENQIPIAESLSKRGLIRWVGKHTSMTIESLSQVIDEELDGRGLRAWSTACGHIVDGQGTERVATILMLDRSTPLKLRTVKLEDEGLLLDWANDSLVRRNSFNTSPIDLDTHRQWFRSRLKDSSGSEFYIAETQNSLPVGQIRFERGEGREWEIHYGLWIGARGRGLGVEVVKLALKKLRDANPFAKVVGYVRPENIPSRRVFEALGFSACHEYTRLVYTLDFEDNLRTSAG
jgi:UDP-2,4-diacetamido-2,4,6-trideoxy-beta-L-altropyranose hydrolase